ncbi:MAG: hypothetical protein HZA90_20605 [Verrucomicrobia bacterium]|nr:hypothetical protein [Verrucomicrobiota bacterium]
MTRTSPEQLSLDRAITTEGQLLVEGRVPEMFFREMIAACGLATGVEARTFGDIDKNNLQTYLELFTQKATFKEQVRRIGIIRDAEGSTALEAFQSVQAALRGAQLPVPDAMNKLEGSPLAVAVFILPNCMDAGMLESLCLSAVAEAEAAQPNAVLPCVNEFFACLDKRGMKPSHPTKAQFAGYALARDVVDPQLGRAAQRGAIPWRSKAFDTLKAFVRHVAGQ